MRAQLSYFLRYLPFELPSRKNDSGLALAYHSIPYVVTGLSMLWLVSTLTPGERLLVPVWFRSLRSLTGWYQKLLGILLTIIWIWFGTYAIGVLLIEKLRPYYRQWIVRRVERKMHSSHAQ